MRNIQFISCVCVCVLLDRQHHVCVDWNTSQRYELRVDERFCAVFQHQQRFASTDACFRDR